MIDSSEAGVLTNNKIKHYAGGKCILEDSLELDVRKNVN